MGFSKDLKNVKKLLNSIETRKDAIKFMKKNKAVEEQDFDVKVVLVLLLLLLEEG